MLYITTMFYVSNGTLFYMMDDSLFLWEAAVKDTSSS